MYRTVLGLIVLVLALAPRLSHADSWSHTTEVNQARSTSIRIVEPEGYQVTVEGRTDTVPAVFALADADAYVVLAMVSPGGARWEKKIEVKAYRQTVVRVTHRADAPAPKTAPTAAKATFIGILANTSHLCRKESDRGAVRIEMVSDGTTVGAYDVAARSRVDAKLPAATYQVRLFLAGTSGWEYRSTQTFEVKKDGWVFDYGCGK